MACEKFNLNNPDNQNLRIYDAQDGRAVAEFIWRKPAKEAMKTLLWAPDETLCLRIVPAENSNTPNYIEVFRDRNFERPAALIHAKFPRKGKNKKDPPIFINGSFDGFALCPMNPKVSPSESP